MHHQRLLAAARAARSRAYAPYSGFRVGAALLTDRGSIYTGANIENSSYGLTICAERVALFSAVHAGIRSFKGLTVVTDTTPPSSPCGACRQVLLELAGDIEVVMANMQGDQFTRSALELLPHPFGPQAALKDWDKGLETPDNEAWRMPVSYNPIGYVRNSFSSTAEIPSRYKELLSEVVLDPVYTQGLYRLDEEERIVIFSHLHSSEGFNLKGERSGRGGEVYGVFSCRTPFRPNPLAQTVVELVGIDNNILTVRGLDLINGTPVLDIKTDYDRLKG